MRISFAPNPWAIAGGLSSGVGQGLYQGLDLSQRRRWQEQQERQFQMAEAIKLLGLGSKSEDPSLTAAINTMLGQVSPGMQLPTPDPMAHAKREQEKIIAQADLLANRMGVKKGTPEYNHLLQSMSGVKGETEFTMMPGPDGQMYPVKKGGELGMLLNQLKTDAYLKKLATGGGGRGSGPRQKMLLWQDPVTGAYLGQGPLPPKPGAVPATASAFGKPEEEPHPQGLEIVKKVGEIRGKLNKGEALSDEEKAVAQTFDPDYQPPAVGGYTKPGFTPPIMKPVKKKRRAATTDDDDPYQGPPQSRDDIPPPPPGYE